MIWDTLSTVIVFVTAYALLLKTDELKFIKGSLIQPVISNSNDKVPILYRKQKVSK